MGKYHQNEPFVGPRLIEQRAYDVWLRGSRKGIGGGGKPRRVGQAPKEWLQEYKRGLSCEDCGYGFDEHPGVCDFHHLDPAEKDSQQIAAMKTVEMMLAEIEKCVPLCANCHRIRHHTSKH